MNWQEDISKAIDYIEEHLTDKLKIEDVCNHVYASSYYFQKGFRIFTGYTISEYIRNRRLYEAALDIIQGDERLSKLPTNMIMIHQKVLQRRLQDFMAILQFLLEK